MNLHADYLTNPVAYDASLAAWGELFAGVASEHDLRRRWSTPWTHTGHPSIRDGNPIFSAWSAKLDRGLRVVQLEPEADGFEFQAYLDFIDPGTPWEITELVIACVLSDAALRIAGELMRPWVAGDDFNRQLLAELLSSAEA